ncbi:MAG TPA: DNRLRE domain-containing protein, partial [Bacteroidota bacterium]|nr:DNRLRE domain-containing protein [Bacteroidota bacterium]
MKPTVAATLLFSVSALFLQACTENPTAVGNQYVDSLQVPRIRIDTLYAASHGTNFTSINTEGTDRVLLGKYPSYDAITLLRFSGLSTSVTDTATITSATLQLHAVYHFGDSLAPIAFSVYRALAPWDTTTYDSLTLLPASYYSTNPISVVPPTILDDTSIVSVPLDTAVVNSWFTPSGSLVNYGIVLVASNVSTIKGFGSFANEVLYDRPTLIVNYVSGGNPGTFVVMEGTARFVANIDKSNLILNPDLMYVQAGVSYRGQLSFNLQGLLPKPAQILRADLELTLDQNNSKPKFFSIDSLFSFYVGADSSLSSPTISQP